MDVESGNRLLIMRSWANWRAPDDSYKCLTINCMVLNGTKTKIGDDVEKELRNIANENLKTLTAEIVSGIDQCEMRVEWLKRFGLAVFLDKVKAEMSLAFLTHTDFEDKTKNRVELNVFVTEKLHDRPIGPFQESESESESLDSMDSASHYYVERLRDYFEY